jgi:hypothetical protein
MGRKPDYILKVGDKDSEHFSARVGVAWKDPKKGHISIHFDPGLSISWNDNLSIILFPWNDEEGAT